jgi:hypothetical protein
VTYGGEQAFDDVGRAQMFPDRLLAADVDQNLLQRLAKNILMRLDLDLRLVTHPH